MKKILIALTIAISCLGINKVSADTIEISHSDTIKYSCDYYVTDYDYLKELGFSDEIESLYNLLIEKYNEEYSSSYPYFYIHLVATDSKNCNQISSFNSVGSIQMYLNLYDTIPLINTFFIPDSDLVILSSYNVSKNEYTLPYEISGYSNLELIEDSSDEKIYNPLGYFISNFNLTYNGTNTYSVTGNSNFTISPGNTIQPIFTSNSAFQNNYIEINLNNYAYIALALKDYDKSPFDTSIYVKGQYCLTPIYNYGMTERKDILEGTQVDRCSPYYDNYTPVRTYILDSDIKNHAIYYFKAYNTSKDNYIKIDSTIFDVTYITEENKDNPYVTINGKTYPTIPYDNLTDTATKSEDEGYMSGGSEKFSFSDIFTAPLEFLEDIWDSIVSVFDLIKELISLLPPVMQNFLLLSFTLTTIMGLLKFIL